MNDLAVNDKLAWYVARSSGIVALVLLVASLTWGVLLATRVLRPHDRPAWLLDLHRWLGGLAVAMTGLHLGGLWLDGYVHFGPAELLVPGASGYRPVAVAFGIVAGYLLVAVEVTSLLRRRLSTRTWRAVHVTSYAATWGAVMHGALAGSDAAGRAYRILAIALTALAMSATLVRVFRSNPRRGRPGQAAEPANPDSQDRALVPSASVA